MTYVIIDACIDVKDESCVAVCPVDCIYADEGDRMRYIHPTECIDCAVCVEACPVAAIYADTDLPAEAQAFLDLNAIWFKDKDAARAQIDAQKPADH